MKIICSIFILVSLLCKAQNPILSLTDNSNESLLNNAYYKDLDGVLNNYVGTWKYTNGSTSLTVVLKKKEQVYNDEWYEDMLIGEYKYVENGIELINTLNLIDSLTDYYNHNITGNSIIGKGQFIPCNSCTPFEKRVLLFFHDPLRDYLSNMVSIRFFTENNIQKIEIQIGASSGAAIIDDSLPFETNVPYGNYVLEKQN